MIRGARPNQGYARRCSLVVCTFRLVFFSSFLFRSESHKVEANSYSHITNTGDTLDRENYLFSIEGSIYITVSTIRGQQEGS